MTIKRKTIVALGLVIALGGCAQTTSSVLASNSIHPLVNHYADKHGVPRKIAQAVVTVESKYNPNARGSHGEIGLGQIKCQTARGVGFVGNCSRLYDPATNLEYSMLYLRQALNAGGVGCAGISLYNTGLGASRVCRGYGKKVMQVASRY